MIRRQLSDARARSPRWRAVAAAGLLLGGVLVGAGAQPLPRPDGLPGFEAAPPLIRPAARRSLTLQQAVAIAMQRYDGRVVRAETKIINGRRVYEIRIIDSAGRVRTIRIDAKTGRFL